MTSRHSRHWCSLDFLRSWVSLSSSEIHEFSSKPLIIFRYFYQSLTGFLFVVHGRKLAYLRRLVVVMLRLQERVIHIVRPLSVVAY